MVEQLWDQAHAGIYIDGDADFFRAASSDLNRIRGFASSEGALDLLGELSRKCLCIDQDEDADRPAAGYRVVIQQARDLVDTLQDPLDGGDDIPEWPSSTLFRRQGTAAKSRVYYLPGDEVTYTVFFGIATPPYIGLAHELIHALHAVNGELRDGRSAEDPRRFFLHEEARTLGIGIYADVPISENSFRQRDGLQQREHYCVAHDCDELAATDLD
ncbi:MAG: hypothetical protein ACI841_000079 [Planctomycetota bacterium]|jgi:hypothetical protein